MYPNALNFSICPFFSNPQKGHIDSGDTLYPTMGQWTWLYDAVRTATFLH